MSSRPGLTLEAFLLWNYNITADTYGEANLSIGIAEVIFNVPKRPHLTVNQFTVLVGVFEAYRESIEHYLEEFDEEKQSWRDYAEVFDFVPSIIYTEGTIYLDTLSMPGVETPLKGE